MFRFESGLSRRGFLQGSVGLSALMLPGVAAAAKTGSKSASRPAKSVIVLLLEGGMSHLESWDPKPKAPENVRGPLGTIATNHPQLRIGENMPQLAKLTHLYNVIRSVHSEARNHSPGLHWLLTGYNNPAASVNGQLANEHPSMGAIVSHQLGGAAAGGLPRFVAIPNRRQLGGRVAYSGASHLGTAHEAFDSGAVPATAAAAYTVPIGLTLPKDVSLRRLQDRNGLLRSLDQLRRQVDDSPFSASLGDYQRQAINLLAGERGRAAFDINRESARTRNSYGNSAMGQSALLARRLVEAGANYVLVNTSKNNSWDHHANLAKRLKIMQPQIDQAAAALLADLEQRGMLDDTMVVMMGEMGRTPTMNKRGGRDHWPDVYSILMAGGGLTRGQVLGSSDRLGAYPHDRPVHLYEVLATMYRQLGVDHLASIPDRQGRQARILPEGTPMTELIAG